MKMELVLVLCLVLCVAADVQHDDLEVVACSPNNEMDMMTLDDEHVWHADFIQETGVVTMPDFVVHPDFTGFYERAVEREKFCKDNLKTLRLEMKDIPDPLDPPTSLIYTAHNVVLGEKNTLICHVSGFCPAPVKVIWIKNGEQVTEGTSISVPFPSKDHTFTQISRLDFTPQLGDIYSCSVDHSSLKKPQSRSWGFEVETSRPSAGPAVLCGIGVTVGLLGGAVGAFFIVKARNLIGRG
ncbi:H-2 class II histocompatibility antigen, E-D alpha chain-like [Anableps anableps]